MLERFQVLNAPVPRDAQELDHLKADWSGSRFERLECKPVDVHVITLRS